jgi:hypothetical protein
LRLPQVDLGSETKAQLLTADHGRLGFQAVEPRLEFATGVVIDKPRVVGGRVIGHVVVWARGVNPAGLGATISAVPAPSRASPRPFPRTAPVQRSSRSIGPDKVLADVTANDLHTSAPATFANTITSTEHPLAWAAGFRHNTPRSIWGKPCSQRRPGPRWADLHWHPRRDGAGKRLRRACGVDRLNRNASPTNARITHSASTAVDVESTEE